MVYKKVAFQLTDRVNFDATDGNCRTEKKDLLKIFEQKDETRLPILKCQI